MLDAHVHLERGHRPEDVGRYISELAALHQ